MKDYTIFIIIVLVFIILFGYQRIRTLHEEISLSQREVAELRKDIESKESKIRALKFFNYELNEKNFALKEYLKK